MFNRKKWYLFIITAVLLTSYYYTGYRRFFISDRTGEKHITVWTSFNNRCYVIPGKYYSPFKPSDNYIETVNHRNYFGIVWDSTDSAEIKLSIYNQYKVLELDDQFKIYDDNETMLSDCGIDKENSSSLNKEEARQISDSVKSAINYQYVDLNRVYGIKIFSW